MFEGWLSFAGVELINNSRTAAYAQALGITAVDGDCCASMAAYLGDREYRDPCADPAPWLDPAVPASGRFAGLYGLDIAGLSRPTTGRTVTPMIGDGSVIGSARRAGRELVVKAVALAAGDDAMSFGLGWLASMLRGGVCGPECVGDPLCVLAHCPCTDGSSSDPIRHLLGAGLLEAPEPVATRVLSTGAMITELEFTLTVGVPYIFTEPVPLHTVSGLPVHPPGPLPGAPTRRRMRAAAINCTGELDCSADPACPPPPAPAPLPVPEPDCPCELVEELTVTVLFTGGLVPDLPVGQLYQVLISASVSAGTPRPLAVLLAGQERDDVLTGAPPVPAWVGPQPAMQLLGVVIDRISGDVLPVTVNTAANGDTVPEPLVYTMSVPGANVPVALTVHVTAVPGAPAQVSVTSTSAPTGRTVQIDGGQLGTVRVRVNGPPANLTIPLTAPGLPLTLNLIVTDVASGETIPYTVTISNTFVVTPPAVTLQVPLLFSQILTLPAASVPEAAEKTHLIEVHTGALALRCLTIEWFSNPLGLPCAEVVGDDCARCGALQVRYLPPGSTLRIDGRDETVTLDCPGFGGLSAAGHLVEGPDGAPYTWPVFDCAIPMCVRVSATERAPDSQFRLWAVARSDAI